MCLHRVFLVKLMEATRKQRHSFCSKCQKAEGKSDGLYKEKACCKQLNTEETIDKDKFYFSVLYSFSLQKCLKNSLFRHLRIQKQKLA